MLDRNSWNQLAVQTSSNNSFRNKVTCRLFSYKSYLSISILDLALHNPQMLICHKTNQPTFIHLSLLIHIYIYIYIYIHTLLLLHINYFLLIPFGLFIFVIHNTKKNYIPCNKTCHESLSDWLNAWLKFSFWWLHVYHEEKKG